MKVFLAIMAAGGVAVFGFVAWSHRPPGAVAASTAPPRQADPPAPVPSGEAEIFRKAFWRKPGAGDTIVHAERHESLDDAGLKRWRWFLEVEASPELIRYLRDDNAFGLFPDTMPPTPEKAPAWFDFQAAGMEFLRSHQGTMALCFSTSGNRLFATGVGHGFRPGAPEPEPARDAKPAGSATGRLPDSMPPQSSPQPSSPPR